jgi:hypothetical protein
MKFLLGVAFGVVGMWAYQTGKLQNMLGGAPEPVQQAFNTASDRVSQLASSDQVRQATSKVQDKVQQATSSASQIVTPSATEVSGRPSEPLPGSQPGA